MNLKIAIPTNENGILDSHFGHARYFEIFETENKIIISHEKLTPPPHKPGSIPKWISEKKVTDVITGGIGEKAVKVLSHFDIKVHKGADQLKSTDLAKSLLNHTLQLTEENCNHHHDHSHAHGHRHEHKNGFRIKQ